MSVYINMQRNQGKIGINMLKRITRYVVVLRAFSQICPPDCRMPPENYMFQENLSTFILKPKKIIDCASSCSILLCSDS